MKKKTKNLAGKQLKRYFLIYECIKDKKYPSFEAIKNYLEFHDIIASERTIQRDFRIMGNEFGLEPIYSNALKGYFFDEEELSESNLKLRYFEVAYLAENINEVKYNKHILFGESKLMNNISSIPKILDAIDRNRIIEFKHENYQKGETSLKRLQPYLVREYQNRWYVLGFKDKTQELRLYGIDRIEDIIITDQAFTKSKNQNLKSLFEHVIGVDYNPSEICKIEFKAPLSQKKYLDSLPLHSSQVHLIDQEGEAFYQIEVVKNFELEQKLLMHSHFITVTAPEDFANYFGQKIQNIANRYEINHGYALGRFK